MLGPHSKQPLEKIMLPPEMARQMLERNTINRPLNQPHVNRIARQIRGKLWRYNGDTIKVSTDEDVLDGQHRLWAIIEANMAVETVVVRGISREAFATIDTLSKPRSGADILAINGLERHLKDVASALTWLLRWQRGCVENYKDAFNRVENSDIEAAFADHPLIVKAVERAITVRRVGNVGIIAFLFYVLSNRNAELAERFIATLFEPEAVSAEDPFFQLRKYFLSDHHQRKNPVTTIALCIKAANAAHQGKRMRTLQWKSIGKTAEEFPSLQVK